MIKNENDKKIKVSLNIKIGYDWDEEYGEAEKTLQSYCEFAEALAEKYGYYCEANFDIEAN